MPIPGAIPFDLKEMGYKIAFVFGALIIIYGVLWLLAVLKIFPQIVLIIIGIAIIYFAYDRKKKYY